MDRIKSCIKEHKKLFCVYLCFACIIGIAIIIMYGTEIRDVLPQPRNVMRVKDGKAAPDNFVMLTEKTNIEQKISMVSKSFTGFSLWFEENETDQDAKIRVKLFDASRKLVEEWEFRTSDIPEDTFFNFYVPKIDVNIGDTYFIDIAADSDNKTTVPMGISQRTSYMKNDLFSEIKINGRTGIKNIEGEYLLDYQILDGTCESLKYFFLFVVILIFALIGIVFILLVTQPKKEWVFVFMALLLGGLYLLVIPPFAAPDEGTHFITAYAQSSTLLGRNVDDEEGNVIFEPDGAIFFVRKDYPDKSSYATYIRGLFGKEENIVRNEISCRKSLNRKSLGYVPQVTGLMLGRLLQVKGIGLFAMGRVMALFWYCFLMFWSLRLIPDFGKNILFVVGLLPMTVQQIVSYNYDSVLLGASFFATAYFFYLVCDKRKEQIQIKDYLVVGVLVLIIVPIKFIYIPLLGIGLLIPKEKFGGIRKKACCIGAVIASSLLIIRIVNWGRISNAVSVGSGTGISKYTLTDCIQNPIQIFVMFFKTIERYGSMYFQSMVGSSLGWLEIEIPDIIICGFVILLFCSLLELQDVRQWRRNERIWFIVLSAGIGGMVILSLLLDWTPKGSAVVEGVQGRYFLPILPLLLLAIQNQTIVLRKKLDTFLVSGVMFLQIAAVLCVVSTVAAR